MENLRTYINDLADGKTVTPPQLKEVEVDECIDLAIHATNFMSKDGLNGYFELLDRLYTQIGMDHGERTAQQIFERVIEKHRE